MINSIAELGSCIDYSHLSCSSDEARNLVAKQLGMWEACRRVCMSTILQLVDAYQVTNEAAAHTIVLLDKFLATQIQDVSVNRRSEFRQLHETALETKLCLKGMDQCFAAACFLLVTKFREVESPCIRDIARILALNCPEKIRLCENEVLECISWDLHTTTGLIVLNFDFFSIIVLTRRFLYTICSL
jgi:hypothetical protein